ncbi:MAG: ATP-grasp domain-containing protein [Planctomycetota bacterium]|nr:ATP-grasp domain-containing protein [Planctomycetota bacterium]
MPQSLSILGASVRSAAQSARRAGLLPCGADLFADRDLQRACIATIRVSDYPHDLIDASRQLPSGPWMYTGGLENYPQLVDQVAATQTLLGNPGSVLCRVRDPWQLAAVLTAHGLASPTLQRDLDNVSARKRSLRKPLQSCGGQRICIVDPGEAYQETSGCFYQRMIPGKAYSAVYTANQKCAGLVGLTRQLVGTAWTGAQRFQYAGSLGPVTPPPHLQSQLVEVGNVLAGCFHLQGLFGVDLILADEAWILEVNPRYTASVEVLEVGFNWPALSEHLQVCQGDTPRPPSGPPLHLCGKAIVYARCDTVISPSFVQFAADANSDPRCPTIADIPHTGERILQRQPITTVLAIDNNWKRLYATLKRRTAQVQALLNC